jgi:hypothetical protein
VLQNKQEVQQQRPEKGNQNKKEQNETSHNIYGHFSVRRPLGFLKTREHDNQCY